MNIETIDIFRSKEGHVLAKDILSEIIATQKINIEKIKKLFGSIFFEHGRREYILRCLDAIRNWNEYTYYHCLNVAFYSALIGNWLRLPESDLLNVIEAALLHDIGKTKISNEIINKKGSLLSNEYKEIKRHTIYGFNLITKNMHLKEDVKNAILMHHEREDGSGYPFGYTGKQISKIAKIVAIADVYDAMTSERAYSRKSTPFEAFDMFLTEGVKLFDTYIIDVFLKKIAPYYVGYKVKLNTGGIAEIVHIPSNCVSRPVIRAGTEYIDFSVDGRYQITSVY